MGTRSPADQGEPARRTIQVTRSSGTGAPKPVASSLFGGIGVSLFGGIGAREDGAPPLDAVMGRDETMGPSAVPRRHHDGIPRRMAWRRSGEYGKPRERRPIQPAGAPALVGLADVDAVPVARADGGVLPICGVLSPAFCAGTYPRRRRRAEVTQLIALSARSEWLSRSLSSWARSAGRSRRGLRFRRIGYPVLRMFPRIGRSLMITQTFPITAWSFEVQRVVVLVALLTVVVALRRSCSPRLAKLRCWCAATAAPTDPRIPQATRTTPATLALIGRCSFQWASIEYN